jgi:hypothetical protein
MVRLSLLLLLVACGGSEGDLIASTSFTISEMSGPGPSSPLDPLYQQVIAFDVEFVAPSTGHDMVDTCAVTAQDSEMPVRTATGETAEMVQNNILNILPVWTAKLALCDPADQSTATIESDNNGGLAVIIGCLGLPDSAMVHDGAYPKWTDFTATKCQATVYDQLHSRLFMGHDFSMTIRR